MDDRQNYLCSEACQTFTGEVQKVAETKRTDLLVHSHNLKTKTSEAKGIRNAGDNGVHGVFVAESINNTIMKAADIALAMDQFRVSCPRCRFIMHRAQKSVQQSPIVDGSILKNFCEHCHAQMKDESPLIKDQFIYSKLKSGGILIWQRKDKKLLKDTKVTKFKHKDLYLSIKRPILTKIDPTIKPLIPSLQLEEESLIGVESPTKKVSIKETVEVIQESQYGFMDLDDKFRQQSFNFKFPSLLKESLKEDKITDTTRSSTELLKDTQARLRIEVEEKKKKNEEIKNYQLKDKEKKRQSRIEKKEKSKVQRQLQRTDDIVDIEGKSSKRSKPVASESKTSKLDEGMHKVKKKQGKGYDFYESDDLDKSRKRRKTDESDERIDRKKREKGQQDFEPTTERKAQQFKKESRGKEDKYGQEKPDKEKVLSTRKKGLQALGTTEERKSDKEKATAPAEKGVQGPGKQKEEKLDKTKESKSDKEKIISVPRKGKEDKFDKEKGFQAPGKESQAPGKEEGKSYKDKASKAHPEEFQASGKGKEGKPDKEKRIPAPGKEPQPPGKELQAPRKEKDLESRKEKAVKSDKEKVLPKASLTPGKGASETPGKKEDKSGKEIGLKPKTEKEKEEKSDLGQILPVSRKAREEKPGEAKDGKPFKEEVKSAPEKGLQVPAKDKDVQSDKEKALPAPGQGKFQSPEKKGDKSGKGKASTAPGKGALETPGKKDDKSVTEKGLRLETGKDKEEKSDKKEILPVSKRTREEKPGDAKDGKPFKEEVKSAPEKGLQVPAKDKDVKSDKEKSLPAPGQGKFQSPEKKDKQSDKEKALPAPGKAALETPGKKGDKSVTEKGLRLETGKDKEEKSDKKEILPVPKRIREEKLGDAKDGKPFKEEVHGKEKEKKSDKEKALPAPEKEEKKAGSNKIRDQIDTADKKMDKINGKASKGKGDEDAKEIIKQNELLDNKQKKKEPKLEAKELIDANKVKVTKPDDNLLLDLILKFEKKKVRRQIPTIIIPPFPAIPARLTQKAFATDVWFQAEFEQEIEDESSIDEAVYLNKIIKKREISLVRGSSGTKERAADIVYNNIFNDDLHQRTGEMSPTARVAESKKNLILSQTSSQDGVFRYALSDRTFIENGWTLLPIEKVVRKTNVYRMRPAHPEFDWFEHNKIKGVMHYDSGEKLAEFKENGLGQWFYRNGRLALDYYDAEDTWL